jgi:protoporphyrin/coproporphyrin ferrochelatase
MLAPMNAPPARIGVLLLQLGGPDRQEAVAPFLRRLFSDPDILPVPGGALVQWPLAWAIAAARAPKVRGYYRRIGGGSPLRRWTERQAELLQADLERRTDASGATLAVAVAMRYAPPFTAEALDRLQNCDALLALTLFPQYSLATTGSSLGELARVRRRRHDQRPLIVIDRWFDARDYWAALAARIRTAVAQLPSAARPRSLILWSAHGLPQRIVDRGDPYVAEIEDTVRGTMAMLGDLGLPYRLAFQSRTGPIRWTRPATDQVIREEGAGGRRAMVVVPVSFVSDHIETLYEIDLLYGEEARKHGITSFVRVDSFNDGADLTAVLGRLAAERLAAAGWIGAPAHPPAAERPLAGR